MVCFSVYPGLFVSLCLIFMFLTKFSVFYCTFCFVILLEYYISASIVLWYYLCKFILLFFHISLYLFFTINAFIESKII